MVPMTKKECASCGYETETQSYPQDSTIEVPNPEPLDFCELCASTVTGNTVQYPRECADVLRTVCHVGNVILDELRVLRKEIQEK